MLTPQLEGEYKYKGEQLSTPQIQKITFQDYAMQYHYHLIEVLNTISWAKKCNGDSYQVTCIMGCQINKE